MIAKIESGACLGIHAFSVHIEVDVSSGLPQLTVVGLPDASIRESKERVRSAIKNSGYRFPPEKITVNLAPANIKKEGPAFDLPIALGILAASGVIPLDKLSPYLFLGELALDGTLRPFKGAIVIAEALYRDKTFVFPVQNAKEAAWEKRAVLYGVKSLKEVVEFLTGSISLQPVTARPWQEEAVCTPPGDGADFQEVKGQALARRAAEVAVAGGHNLLLLGSPGSGKTMIASRIPSIMPPLSFEQALEITKLYSIAGVIPNGSGLIRRHPFRAPHHNISAVAMAGGGPQPRPGEISLAHGGVLFLDEFPEFKRDAIEALRTPLEEGMITVSRVKMQISYPCRLMLVAAMNPCPCGYLSDPRKACRCSLGQIQKYRARISGPVLDRIDMHIEVQTITYQNLVSTESPESSKVIRERVIRCREIQEKRFGDRLFKLNAFMQPKEIKLYATPDPEGQRLLERAMKQLHLSARAYYKILKIARTLADLARAEKVCAQHIAEAIQYRSLDRQW